MIGTWERRNAGRSPMKRCARLGQTAIRLLGLWVGTTIVALTFCQDCRADLLIFPQNVVAAPGSSGSFDVLLSNNGGTFDVAGDTVELSLTGISGVSFTNVSISTTVPYIYVNSATLNGGGPLSFDTFPNTHFTASDTEFAAPGFRTVSDGAMFGLAHVDYSVDANALIGSVGSLVIGASTSLSDTNGGAIAFTASNGTFSVLSPAVPEPSSLILLGGGALGMVYLLRRR